MLEIARNANKTWNFEDFFFRYIDSHCPYLLFGETTSHLTIKWRGTFSIVFFFNVENSIKRKMRNNYSSKFYFFSTPPSPPPPEFCFTHNFFFLNVGNSMKRLENMKFWRNFKFKQHSINIKNYTAHLHHLVHVPAKFRENTAMRFWVTVRKLNVTDRRTDRQTDRQTDGGRCNISRPRAYGAGGR